MNNTSLNIDEFWLDDNTLDEIRRQTPSLGEEGVRSVARMHREIVQSEVYRGYANVLWMLRKSLRRGARLDEQEAVIDAAHESMQTSTAMPPGTPISAGACLALTNAWERTHSPHAAHFDDVCEAELVLVARLYFVARERGL